MADPKLSTAPIDTSQWGREASLPAGLFDAAATGPFAPFTQGPQNEAFRSLVQVQLPADVPSVLSRDVLVYVTAKQNYTNNRLIVNAAGAPISTPNANQQPANAGLYGLIRSGRGGVFSEEEFQIPANGIALHVGAESVEVEVGFFPSRTGWGSVYNGAMATGWDIKGGVATAGSFVDRVRQGMPVDSSTADLVFQVPEFARRLKVDSMVPDMYLPSWLDWRGLPLETAAATVGGPTSSAIYYVDAAQPIPIDARAVQVLKLTAAFDETNIHQQRPFALEWEREA